MDPKPLIMVWGHFHDTLTLVAIMKYKLSHDGNSPNIRELAGIEGHVNHQMTHKHVKRLVEEKLLEWKDGKLCVTPLAYRLFAEETPYAQSYTPIE